MRRMEGAMRRSSLVVLDEAGHLANLEQPDAFGAALGRFLSSLS
jgi:pimeloyl-ACP methyl ester carboxylesterase